MQPVRGGGRVRVCVYECVRYQALAARDGEVLGDFENGGDWVVGAHGSRCLHIQRRLALPWFVCVHRLPRSAYRFTQGAAGLDWDYRKVRKVRKVSFRFTITKR
jgi:hypothetical protein